MSMVRFAPVAPVRLVQLAIASFAVLALMAVMSAPAQAGHKSLVDIGKVTVIGGDVNIGTVEIEADRVVSGNDVNIIKNSTIKVLTGNTLCVQAVTVLSAQCKAAVETEILNDLELLAIVPINVDKVKILG